MSNLSAAYDVVVKAILAEMDKGVVPWNRDWTMGLPKNAESGRAYNGINVFLLAIRDFTDSRWLTFNQIAKMKGKVKKGEKATQIVLWTFVESRDKQDKRNIPLLRYYNVFNVEQVEGIDFPPDTRAINDLPSAEEIVLGYADKPKIVEENLGKPSYIPKRDIVTMPKRAQFSSDDAYYHTLFHELIHSTGAEQRLNRMGVANFDGFGTDQYSEEELIAEFGASFLDATANISDVAKKSAAYIAGWKSKITDNPKILVHAASKAQKAADYILTGAKGNDFED